MYYEITYYANDFLKINLYTYVSVKDRYLNLIITISIITYKKYIIQVS